jgi:hypothetical protein
MQLLTRPDGCLSDLLLDEWLAGELEADARSSADAHLAGCRRCKARREALRRVHAEFLERAPSFEAHAEVVGEPKRPARARLRRRRVWTAASAVALAAAALLALPTTPGLEPPGTRVKGAPHVGFFVKHDGRVALGVSGQTVHPGDALRFTYSSDRALHLALLNQDAVEVTVYFADGARAVYVPAGSDVPLAFSVELDDRLGSERVYAVFCPKPFAVEPLRVALGHGQPLPVAPDCVVEVIALHKEARR